MVSFDTINHHKVNIDYNFQLVIHSKLGYTST